MVKVQNDLWSIVRNPYVDAALLADAIIEQIHQGDLDYRSRLLIRDSLKALEHRWGAQRFNHWITAFSIHPQLATIYHETFEKTGFSTLEKRVMEFTTQQDLEEMFRAIGSHLRSPINCIDIARLAGSANGRCGYRRRSSQSVA
jgi:hypothetical protein